MRVKQEKIYKRKKQDRADDGRDSGGHVYIVYLCLCKSKRKQKEQSFYITNYKPTTLTIIYVPSIWGITRKNGQNNLQITDAGAAFA